MDEATLMHHRSLWGQELGDKRCLQELANLQGPEEALFRRLRDDVLGERVRLEQERIPYPEVIRAVAGLYPWILMTACDRAGRVWSAAAWR